MALDTNLVSYWKLDESSGNAADSVGSNTLTNTNVTYGTGKINNGAISDAHGDTLSRGDTASLNITGAMSFAAWVKFDSSIATPGHYKTMVSRSVRSYSLIVLNNGTGITRDMYITLSKDSGGSEQSYIEYNANSLSNGVWYHIGWTYTPSTSLILYINGSAVSTNTTSIISSIYGGTGNFLMLYDGGANDDGLISMDEVGIWSRALSSIEFGTLYNAGAGLQYPFITTNSGAGFFNFM